MPNEKEWLVQKDGQQKWYFHHGKYAPQLVSEVAHTDLRYLENLIEKDMGHISLDARNYIDWIIKSKKTKAANAGS